MNFFKLFLLTSLYLFISCASRKKSKNSADVLFDQIDKSHTENNSVERDTLRSSLENFDISTLDSAHQKAFWFNAYGFFMEDYLTDKHEYLNSQDFDNHKFIIARDTLTASKLMVKLAQFQDPRLLVFIDFFTTNSSKSKDIILTKNIEQELDDLTYKFINDSSLVRVKKDIKRVYYPEYFDWQLQLDSSWSNSKTFILKYHTKSSQIANYQFKAYPFSRKFRGE